MSAADRVVAGTVGPVFLGQHELIDEDAPEALRVYGFVRLEGSYRMLVDVDRAAVNELGLDEVTVVFRDHAAPLGKATTRITLPLEAVHALRLLLDELGDGGTR